MKYILLFLLVPFFLRGMDTLGPRIINGTMINSIGDQEYCCLYNYILQNVYPKKNVDDIFSQCFKCVSIGINHDLFINLSGTAKLEEKSFNKFKFTLYNKNVDPKTDKLIQAFIGNFTTQLSTENSFDLDKIRVNKKAVAVCKNDKVSFKAIKFKYKNVVTGSKLIQVFNPKKSSKGSLNYFVNNLNID